MPKLIAILSCSYFHVLMLWRDQTHPQQEIMFEFLPFYHFTPFPKNTNDNTNTFLSCYDSDKPFL